MSGKFEKINGVLFLVIVIGGETSFFLCHKNMCRHASEPHIIEHNYGTGYNNMSSRTDTGISDTTTSGQIN